MKKPLIILGLALVSASAHAQISRPEVLNTGTNVIAASGTLSPTNAIITSAKHANVALQASFKLSGTGVGNVVLSFAKSVDGVRFESTPSVTMTIAASGTNTVAAVSNVSLGAVPALKLVSVTNANTPSTVAELSVKSFLKPEQ